MDSEEILRQSDQLIRDLFMLLKEQRLVLNHMNGSFQQKAVLRAGYYQHDGLYVPLSIYSHKIIFDGYHAAFLDTFIELAETLLKEKDSKLTEFSLRTLAEMGFFRTQILFDPTISDNFKKRYKLLLMLCDYGSMAIEHPEHFESYKKLFQEYESLLGDGERVKFQQLMDAITARDPIATRKFVEESRKLISSLQGNLFGHSAILPIFNPANIKAMFSGFSHILHGDILLIGNLLSSKSVRQHNFRIYWFLMLTCVNVSNFVGKFIGDSAMTAKVETFNVRFNPLSLQVKKLWETTGHT